MIALEDLKKKAAGLKIAKKNPVGKSDREVGGLAKRSVGKFGVETAFGEAEKRVKRPDGADRQWTKFDVEELDLDTPPKKAPEPINFETLVIPKTTQAVKLLGEDNSFGTASPRFPPNDSQTPALKTVEFLSIHSNENSPHFPTAEPMAEEALAQIADEIFEKSSTDGSDNSSIMEIFDHVSTKANPTPVLNNCSITIIAHPIENPIKEEYLDELRVENPINDTQDEDTTPIENLLTLQDEIIDKDFLDQDTVSESHCEIEILSSGPVSIVSPKKKVSTRKGSDKLTLRDISNNKNKPATPRTPEIFESPIVKTGLAKARDSFDRLFAEKKTHFSQNSNTKENLGFNSNAIKPETPHKKLQGLTQQAHMPVREPQGFSIGPIIHTDTFTQKLPLAPQLQAQRALTQAAPLDLKQNFVYKTTTVTPAPKDDYISALKIPYIIDLNAKNPQNQQYS